MPEQTKNGKMENILSQAKKAKYMYFSTAYFWQKHRNFLYSSQLATGPHFLWEEMQSTEPLKPYKDTSRPPVAHTLFVIMN